MKDPLTIPELKTNLEGILLSSSSMETAIYKVNGLRTRYKKKAKRDSYFGQHVRVCSGFLHGLQRYKKMARPWRSSAQFKIGVQLGKLLKF